MNRPQLERRLIGALLRVPFQYIVAEINSRLVELGYDDLSPSHFVVFQHMRSEGIRASELAAKAQVTKQAMGYLVTYLEERGYVERKPDPSDGRARLVCLTERGWQVAGAAMVTVEIIEAEWEIYLGSERMQSLRSILRELIAHLGDNY
jgi:DNA-binding MarR family transcriptional regulator